MRGRRLLFNLHLCVGLVAAVFVAILGLTGSIMAFEADIVRLTHPSLSFITPGGQPRSLAELTAATVRAFPGEEVQGYGISRLADEPYQVFLARRAVAVNQYSGAVLGPLPPGPGWLNFVHQLHTHLGVRSRAFPGKQIVGWAGLLMLVLLLSGLYLWWPLKQVRVRWNGATRRSWFDLHNAIGITSYLFLLVLTLTGLSIGFENVTTPFYYRLTGSHPSQAARRPGVPPPGAVRIPPDSAVAIARGALPGAAPYLVSMPAGGDPYDIRMRFPEDRTPGGRSRVLVHPYTGEVLFAEGSRTAPAGLRAVIANRAIHTGDLFGYPTKILMSLASLLAVAQVTSGVLMWWYRDKGRASTPPTGSSNARS